MAIVAKSPRSTPITLAAPSAGPFLVGFPLFDLDALEVYIDGVRTEDFTISASFVGGVDIAATVTFGAEVLAGSTIIINGALSPRREADYLPRDPGLTDKLNNEFSRVWSSLQEVKRDTGRSLRAFSDQDAIETEDGAVLMWDGDQIGNGPTGDEISGAQAAATAAQAAQAAAEAAAMVASSIAVGADFEQTITSGTVSSYTFPFVPATLRNVSLTIGGVRQSPTLHYALTDGVTPGRFDTLVFDPVEATLENPVFIQARFAFPDAGADTVLTDSGLTVQEELDRIGRSYFSRAQAVAATIPADVNRIWVLHDGVWLDYVRDATGTALVTDGGVEWSPASTITVRHWGAVGGATMAADGTVSGTDCTAAAQAMLDWVATFTPVGASRSALPSMEWGRGNFCVSGSLNLTTFGTNARMILLTGYGTTIYADGAGARVFDLTDAQYIELAGFTIIGSIATTPLCAVKTGRKGNNDGAAYVTLRDIRTRAGTNEASVRSCFKVAALWQMASETSHEINCIWENFYGPSGALTADISDVEASITLDTVAGFPASGLVRIGKEKIRYASIAGTTLNGLTRGADGSSALSHLTDADAYVCDMAYGAAFDNINALCYAEPIPLTSFVAGSPAVFTSVGHGLSEGDTVVATVTSVPTLRNSGVQYNIEGRALTVGWISADTFSLSDEGVALADVLDETGVPAAIPTNTKLAKELITPSTFIGASRAEPFKRHSQLHNLRESNTYFSHVGRAGVMVGCSEGTQFRDCFIVGKTGFHMLYTQQRSANDLHWAQCNFGDHLEGGGTIGDVEDWMLVAPAMSYAGTVARFNKCKFWDNTMQADYMVNQTSGVDVRFVDCDFSIARNAFSFVGFAKAPADVFILGGAVGMGELTNFNITATNRSCSLTDYGAEDFILPIASYEVLSNTANSTVTFAALGRTINDTTTLTANVTRSLVQTGAFAGASIRFMRTGANGAFTFNVRDQASATNIKALATGQWVDCVFDGTAWRVSAFGSL